MQNIEAFWEEFLATHILTPEVCAAIPEDMNRNQLACMIGEMLLAQTSRRERSNSFFDFLDFITSTAGYRTIGRVVNPQVPYQR